MLRDFIDRARLALGDLWRKEPTRVVGYVVTVLAAAGVTVLTEDVAAVLAVLVPLMAGTEGIRSRVSPVLNPGQGKDAPQDGAVL